MTDDCTRTRLKRIAEIKDIIAAYNEHISICKTELLELLPQVQEYMEINDIDEFDKVGAYKICRRSRTKQPTMSKKFISSKVEEFLVQKHIHSVSGVDLVDYLYQQRKELGTQIEEIEVKKLTTSTKRKRAEDIMDSTPTVFIASTL